MSRAWPVADIDPNDSLATNARRILAVKVAEFYSYAPAIAVEEAKEPLHDLRIAAKRLRYTLELFRVVFGKTGERQIERVKALQEELGELHDNDVHIALIEAELRHLAYEQVETTSRELASAPAAEHATVAATSLRPPADDPRRGLIALLGRQHEARRGHYRQLVTLWNRYLAEGMRAELVELSAAPVRRLPAMSEEPGG